MTVILPNELKENVIETTPMRYEEIGKVENMTINKEELIVRASAVLGRDVTHEAIMKTVESLVEMLEKEKAASQKQLVAANH